jgi:starvation-inducible outer membrane lipoprotein
MKKLVLVGCLALSACSGLPYGFDNVGYFNIVKLKHEVVQTQAQCERMTADTLNTLIQQAALTDLYIANAPADVEVKEAIQEISGQIREFAAAYAKPLPPTVAYCENKMGIVSDELTVTLTTIGNKK